MTQWIENFMQSMGYFGIGFLMFLENVFPPIPSELIMPLAGFTAARGQLSFIGAVIAGIIGSTLGQLPLYYLGRWAGEERLKGWADKYGKWLTVSRKEIDKAQGWFDRHGGKAVFFCRMVPGIRSLISIPAGMAGMKLRSFLLYSVVGIAIWSTALAWLGRVLGQNYEAIGTYLGPVTYIVVGGLFITAAVWVYKRRKEGRHERSSADRREGEPA
ncbi:MAG: DedA family protein [Oscillochloris sp.]|nr:DedA family protein [Oscillochloris sp.]